MKPLTLTPASAVEPSSDVVRHIEMGLSSRALGAVLITVLVLMSGCSRGKGRESRAAPTTNATTPTSVIPMSGGPQGCVVFSRRGPDAGLHVLAADGTFRRITTEPGDDQAAWSPDGTTLVFNRENGDQRVYAMNANGGGLAQLTAGTGDASPTWSPDGSRILFMREVPGRWDFYAMKPDGTGLRRLIKGGVNDATPVWSPDGSSIAFVGTGSRNLALYVMRSDGSGRKRIGADINAAWPRWSPDGIKIVFVDQDDGSIHVMKRDGTGQRKVFDVATLPGDTFSNFTKAAWSPDGTKLVFAAGNPQTSHLYIVGIDGTGIRQLTTGAVTDESPDWSSTPACRLPPGNYQPTAP
jgi:Tol biopolymer transport system component